MMKILLSNDDGVYAIGLSTLAKALKTIAEVIVVAPDRNRSGASNSLSLDNPVRAHSLENGYFCVDGTPTDCVHLAVTGLLESQPDMVISGINAGANLGDDILYSGTVAAAMEGRFLGFPSIAVSLVSRNHGFEFKHYNTAATVIKELVVQLQHDLLPKQTILNVNVPDIPLEELQGFEITRLGSRHIAETIVKATDPRGQTIYWIGPAGSEEDAGPGTDFHAIKTGHVSITPLQLDLTNYKAFDQVASWLQGLKL